MTIPTGANIAEAAVQAARRGWHVFPCRPGDKRPAIDRWDQRASADPEHVEAAWRDRYFAHNYGVACGRSGLVVVDLDVREGLDGRAQFFALCRDRGLEQPPQTLMVRTPSGGVHLFFAAPLGREVRNSASRIGSGIDVRGRGGYVVGPRSVVGCRPYAVMANLPVLPLPDWLAELAVPALEPGPEPGIVTAAAPSRSRLVGLADAVLSAPVGQRNTLLHWASCRAAEMVSAGVVDAGAAAVVMREAAVRNGLSEREAMATITSGLRSAGAA